MSGSEATEKEDVPDVKEQHADLESEKIRRGWDPSGWSPEEATQQVWSGVESYSGEIIEMRHERGKLCGKWWKGRRLNEWDGYAPGLTGTGQSACPTRMPVNPGKY